VAGFDETGFRVEGKLEAMGVLPSFSGAAVHDAWAPYDLYTGASPSAVLRAVCGIHVLRELQAVADTAPDGQWCWATQAAKVTALFRAACRWWWPVCCGESVAGLVSCRSMLLRRVAGG
jgi:Transposase IS66 family